MFKNLKWIQWFKYSGVAVIFSLNPFHWQVVPWFRREHNHTWSMPNEKTWAFGFLAITIRIWVDNGDW